MLLQRNLNVQICIIIKLLESVFIVADIVKLVTKGQKPYFRPTLPDQDANDEGCGEELSNVIRRCWAEDAAERPDFHSLKTIIKRMNK